MQHSLFVAEFKDNGRQFTQLESDYVRSRVGGNKDADANQRKELVREIVNGTTAALANDYVGACHCACGKGVRMW